MSENALTLAKIKKGFSEAETALKDCEQRYHEFLAPVVNELRYAGYHLILAIEPNPLKPDQTELKKAWGHIRRAKYDCLELRCMKVFVEIDSFEDRYRDFLDVVARSVPNYIVLRQQVLQIRSQRNVDFGDHWDNRDGFEPKHQNHILELESIWQQLAATEPIITAECVRITQEAQSADDQRIREHRRFVTTCFIAILGIFISIIFGCANLSPKAPPQDPGHSDSMLSK